MNTNLQQFLFDGKLNILYDIEWSVGKIFKLDYKDWNPYFPNKIYPVAYVN
jgi:hypothetical protein